jgi:hypothetical protein
VYANTQKSEQTAPGPEIVAKAIFKAANSRSFKLRYPASMQSSMLLMLRHWLPLSWFNAIVRTAVEKGYKRTAA